MPIDFQFENWNEIKTNYRKWWAGELRRPLIQMSLTGCDPGRPAPKIPEEKFTAFYSDKISPAQIVDRWDYNLSGCKFIGDGFPAVWPNFGPGIIATFLGAKLVPTNDTCWFYAQENLEISKLQLKYHAENYWLNRIQAICQAANDRWQGLVQVGLTDLGGNLDIVSTFRHGEKLLMDLIDQPEEVERVTWEAHAAWWQYYEELHQLMRPPNPGYTAWTAIFSEEPYYMLQCDFCYMISPAMFDRFVKPELVASCKKLKNAFYHLDGPGQLPHLDSLLEIEELKGVQWIPGACQPDCRYWPEVYRKIHAAGKLIQIWGEPDALDRVAEQIGTAEGIIFITSMDISREQEALACLKKYQVI
jgi:5-methyltetrahydrofolate--homocysteine methyltransferase